MFFYISVYNPMKELYLYFLTLRTNFFFFLEGGVPGGGATWKIFTRMCVLKVWKRTHFEGHI